MKKTLTLLLLVTLSAFSYKAFTQTFGIKGGLNLSKMILKDEDDNYSDRLDTRTGYHFGPSMNFSLNDLLSIEASLLVSTKGYRYEESDEQDSYMQKLNLTYLDLPITLKATKDISESVDLFILAGPYLGYGISGKVEDEETYNGMTDTDTYDVNWGTGDNDDLKPFEFGLEFGVGAQFGQVQISVLYDFSLNNISAQTDYGMTFKNKVFKVSAAYFLNKNGSN